MADCSYARCLQERRTIKRELQRWTKNMVYVVGLERVAEELMGRRKWKLYQDVLLARDLSLHQSEENDTSQERSAAENQETNPPENNGSDREDQPMIATAEALQRNNSAADLTQDKEEKEADRLVDTTSPIPVDEDSKETKQLQTVEDAAGHKEENNCVNNQTSTIKIKTIEEINTVGNDSGNKNSNSNTTETILESLIKRSSTGPPRPKPLPTDWKPQDKCYFCVDGELVRPGVEQTSAAQAPPEQSVSPQTIGVESGSESGSSRSSPKTGQPRNIVPNLPGIPGLQNQGQPSLSNIQANFLQVQAFAHLLQLQQSRAQQQPTLNQMAASLATLGALPNLNPALALCSPAFMPHWLLQQQKQQQERQPQEEHTSPPPRSPAPTTAEQPLDLSAKPNSSGGSANISPLSPSSLEARLAGFRGTPIDKQLFNRTKPRLAPTPGRRAYTEAELQMALRDIQSGRLGTRKAAVIYNIPRSTLRNKVYKMEKERGARLPEQLSGAAPRVDDSNDNGEEIDDVKDSANEEDKDDDREPQRPQMDDAINFSQTENPPFGESEHLRALLGKGQKFFDMSSPKQDPAPEPQWPVTDQTAMNAYIQQMILANVLGAQLQKPEENAPPTMVPDLLRLYSDEHNNILKETLLKRDHLNNGKQPELSEEESALNKRLFSRQSSTASSVIMKNDIGLRKTDSPEETPMDVDQVLDESRDSNVILKIPSFKPVGPGSNSGKNGGEGFPGSGTPPLSYFSHSPHSDIPAGRPSDRLSPSSAKGMFMLRDIITQSISQKFRQQTPITNHNNDLRHLKVSSPGMDPMDAYKRSLTSPGVGQGSVIKNMAPHGLPRPFDTPNSGLQNQQNNSTGGKGTRPKRGKYRNYDRDSLVEAVKAVQRGEMSVHRAGSYYGVPHSTLEYKVKERHLMRPRKREPKNPNPDDKQTPGVSKPTDISSVGILRTDKSKIMQKPPVKPNFPATSPNGLKMPPIFDGNLPLGYNPPPFPFWPHGPSFSGLPVDFQQRNPGAPGNFPPNSESFYASQMMQKLQEESAKHPALTRKDSVGESSRDVQGNVENPSGANGSFVENIIRTTLERQRPNNEGENNDVEDVGRRRLRPDDLILAEEMREAARRLRAREAAGPLGVAPQSTQSHPS